MARRTGGRSKRRVSYVNSITINTPWNKKKRKKKYLHKKVK